MLNTLKYFNISATILFIIALNTATIDIKSKEPNSINWISFEQLNDSLVINPKKVMIDFYADWCQQCREMKKNVFTNPRVIEILNSKFYAVKMDVESNDTIAFGNQIYINERIDKRNPIHQIPLLMASRKDVPFSLPAIIFMDENFKATSRYFQFLDSVQLIEILEDE